MADPTAICVESIHIMATGDPTAFAAVVHPEAVNREAKDEPPACRGRGPAAYYATSLWLRAAYSDLRWEIHDTVADGNLVAVHATMRGRHTGDFVAYGPDGTVEAVFPPTGQTFATTQSHWFRVVDGMVIEHWANRDDLGTAKQLGWVPPTPLYLLRSALARRRARSAHA
ncbi:ester cyclase [Micromonospora chersina]|uniref:ester cyclase n=1 Tax=Micromonospora chersina TaxID=47854 RepID=UPI003714B63A